MVANRSDPLTEWQIETIRQAFIETGNVAYAARAANVTDAQARLWCNSHWQQLAEARRAHKSTIAQDLTLVRRLVLEELISPNRLKKLTASELLRFTEILTDKITVMEGGVTNRTHVTVDARASLLSPEDREHAREIQRKLTGQIPMATGMGAENIVDAVSEVK